MVLKIAIKRRRVPLGIRLSSQSDTCSVSRLVVFNSDLLGGLSVQPAAMENKTVKMEEIGKRKLPGRHGLPIIVSHKPINLVTPALSLGRAFFHLSRQHFISEIGILSLFQITIVFISEIGVTLETREPFFSLLTWSVMRRAGAELQEAKPLVLVLEGSFPLHGCSCFLWTGFVVRVDSCICCSGQLRVASCFENQYPKYLWEWGRRKARERWSGKPLWRI